MYLFFPQDCNHLPLVGIVFIFLLDIIFIYILIATLFPSFLSESPLYPAHPHTSRLASQPTQSYFLALLFPCTGPYNLCKTRASSPIDGQLGHPLPHMQLET